MRIKQFVIMIMIICGCVSAGCKNTYEDWEQVGEFKINSRSVEQDVKMEIFHMFT